MTYHKTLNDKLSAMEYALTEIWDMVSNAEKYYGGRISKDQRINIMQWCAHGLGIDVAARARKTAAKSKGPDDAA